VNKLFQDFNGPDTVNLNQNNAYDIKYCESNRSLNPLSCLIKGSMNFFFTPSFYIGCEIFKWFNLVNNILNNGLFFNISVFVDIFMIRYSNKVIEKKITLNSPHLNEAIAYKTKLNKMIITNGALYFISHIPEFVVILIYHFVKSDSLINFCYVIYDCTSIIEMAQAFHFISIEF
jgi:hypothetical protein